MKLPRMQVDLTGSAPRAQATSLRMLLPGELTRIVRFDSPIRSTRALGERAAILHPGRWAVGRCVENRVVWRIVDEENAIALGHPAMLWTIEQAFDLDIHEDEPLPAPEPLTLRQLLSYSEGLGRTRNQTVNLLAAVLGLIRQAKKAVAVIIPEEILQTTAQPQRWFVLAVLTALPTSYREGFRVSWHEVAPDPEDWDLVFTCFDPGDKFTVIDSASLIDPIEDTVSHFIRNRLLADDPEAVEEVAYAADSIDSDDAWADAVRINLQEFQELEELDIETLSDTHEDALLALLTQLDSGTELTAELAEEISQVTALTGDSRPWLAIADRSQQERHLAFTTWLGNASATQPTVELIEALGQIAPPNASMGPWYAVLIEWFRAGLPIPRILEVVDASLDTRESMLASTTSVWSELVLTMAQRDQGEAARSALLGPSGAAIAGAGAGRSIVLIWLSLPEDVRTPNALYQLIDLLAEAPDGDSAVAMLVGHMHRRGARRRDLVLGRWAQNHEQRPFRENDQVVSEVTTLGLGSTWIRVVAEHVAPERLAEVVLAMGPAPDDEVWRLAEQAQSESMFLAPAERLLEMLPMLKLARPALEATAIRLMPQAFHGLRLPNEPLCDLAYDFAQSSTAHRVWSFVAIIASTPQRFDGDTLDGTFLDYIAEPPTDEAERQAVLAGARALGGANLWSALELARWLVRMLLSISPNDFNIDVAEALTLGVMKRKSGATRMAAITTEMIQLPADHLALTTFLERLLPQAMSAGVPAVYRSAVVWRDAPDSTRRLWEQALEAAEQHANR
jgi:hypothetical protein